MGLKLCLRFHTSSTRLGLPACLIIQVLARESTYMESDPAPPPVPIHRPQSKNSHKEQPFSTPPSPYPRAAALATKTPPNR